MGKAFLQDWDLLAKWLLDRRGEFLILNSWDLPCDFENPALGRYVIVNGRADIHTIGYDVKQEWMKYWCMWQYGWSKKTAVHLLSCVRLFTTLWTAARQAFPSSTISPGACSNSHSSSRWCHLILCRPLLLLPSIFPSIRVFFWSVQSKEISRERMYVSGIWCVWVVCAYPLT